MILVVEASAGSGKTYTLAKRYVQLCLQMSAKQAVPIQSILAITFTNKATLEMKSRILDFLKRIALKKLTPEETQDILGPLKLDPKQASERAFGLMKDVIRQYHYFQVQTIDSFIKNLLAGCSFKIGLSAGFKIKHNFKEYLQLSLDELLDQAHDDAKTRQMFTDFVRQYLFLENRSGWFPHEDLLKVINEIFQQYNNYQKPLLVYPGEQDSFAHKKLIYKLMQELKAFCPPQTAKKFMEHLEEILTQEGGLFDIDNLSTYWAREVFPANKGAEITPALEKLWVKISREICELCVWEARSIFNAYVVLFEQVLSRFGSLSRRDDILFLEELNRKAALLFENDLVTVEELYFRLAARFQHYLMDEFQDTSLSQWRNLAPMVNEALAQDGSLFYVGDKKQAIYAFRGGESRLFDALQVELQSYEVENVTLEKNYRSASQIIEFNNRVFSLDNLRDFLQRRKGDIHFSQDDFAHIANTFKHAQQVPGKDLKGGVVRVVHLDGRVKEDRAADVRVRLITLIKELEGRFALKDIAILTRGNHELEEITQWLLQEGVYASSERSSDIKANPLIAEIMAFLGFLYSPADNNAFAQFCLGDLMPKATGVSSGVLQDFLFECAKRRHSGEMRFYEELRKAFPDVWKDFFEDFFRQAGIYPLYDLAAGIIHRFGCEKYFPQYQGFLMHFLELIKKLEQEDCSLASFLDYYENLEGKERFVPMTQVDALQVLTVHKAKGLEFPVVVIPYLEMDIQVGSGGRDGSQAYILDIQEEGIGLVRIKEKYRKFSPDLQKKYEEEYRKAFLIELNNIYVALTRPIEELYVFVPSKVGNAVNPARFLVPEDALSVGTPAQRSTVHEKADARLMIKPFISDPWQGLQEEFLQEPVKSVGLARQGEFYHAVLANIGKVNDGNIDEVVQKAWDKACGVIASAEGAKQFFIRDFIARPDVRPFFYLPEGAEIFCEKEFVNKFGDTRRIDRLIVLKDEVWIIDYKLSPSADEENQEQLQEYIELVRQFYSKHKISGHILYLL